jgi:pimeloyl-ACP methyl ester carboxylesterase
MSPPRGQRAATAAGARLAPVLVRLAPGDAAQNQQRAKTPLTVPVLAIGGAESAGRAVGEAMELAADDVQTLVIPDCGHFVSDEAPKQLLAALIPFPTP